MALWKKLHIPYTIKAKFVLLSMLIALIPLVTLALFSYFNYNSIIKTKVSDTTSNMLSVINWNINTMIRDIEDISNVILTSRDIQNSLSAKEGGISANYYTGSNIQDLLINITNNKEFINAVFVGNERSSYLQRRYGPENDESLTYDTVYRSPWYKKLQMNEGKGIWFDGDALNISSHNMLMYGRIIKNLNTTDKIGVLTIGVDKRVFDAMFQYINETRNSQILILSENAVVYYTDHQEDQRIITDSVVYDLRALPLMGGTIKLIDNKQYLVNYMTNAMTGWKIISMIPNEKVVKESESTKNLTIILAVVSFMIALTGAFLISNKITDQLKLLRLVIKKVARKENVAGINFDSRDEVGQIGGEFQRMIKQNEELNINLYKAIIKEREAELIALQAQINPHFLYNTLDSIFWMAEAIKAKNISKMVICLSKMFKLNLNNGEPLTLVKNEIEQIKNYLEIQNIRYDNKYTTHIDIDETILEERMIKLIIQPIVENAIYHGLELKEDSGSIHIVGRKADHLIIFEVTDNGVGFEVDHTLAKGKGYALKNVDERIKLYYGPEYGLTINSTHNVGTRVEIRIGLIPD